MTAALVFMIASVWMSWGLRECRTKTSWTYFIENLQRVAETKGPFKNDYPLDLTTGTNCFFNTSIIEHQHVAGVKSLLSITDSLKELTNDTHEVTSTPAHKVFTELVFKKLMRSTIEKFQLELASVTGQKVPFFGTGRVAPRIEVSQILKM